MKCVDFLSEEEFLLVDVEFQSFQEMEPLGSKFPVDNPCPVLHHFRDTLTERTNMFAGVPNAIKFKFVIK